MPKDKRDLLDVLKWELEFVQKGGYHRKLWGPQFVFEDSPTCLNYEIQQSREPCTDCILMELVPPDRRVEKVPCRYIPLNQAGATIDYFYRCGTQQEIEEALAEWLRKTIHRLEEQKARKGASGRIEEEPSPSTATAK